MKKIFMMAVMAAATLTANAQWWAGGSFGLDFSNTSKANGDQNTTSFEIAPEVGYNLSDKWAVAMAVGFGTSNNSNVAGSWRDDNDAIYSQQSINGTKLEESSNYFMINPYARYTFYKTAPVSFFVDGGIGFKFFNHEGGNQMSVGVRPGISFAATKKLSLVASTGYLGYLKNSEKAGDGSKFLIGMFNSINFAAYYNF
jgi:hypothetical protein